MTCETCGGSGVVPHTGRGEDGFDLCPSCSPAPPSEQHEAVRAALALLKTHREKKGRE